MTLGNNGPLVSVLGMGCGRMTSRKLDDENEYVATIHAAMDAGITFLDTADFYGAGQSEMMIGRAVKGRRDRAFISVKCGMMTAPSGHLLGIDGRPEAIKNYATYSLKRLGVDAIDLFQPGRPDPSVPFEETVGAVADLIQQGYVQFLGVTEVGADTLRRANRVHHVTALEIEYSLACRFIEAEILPTARELGVGIVSYRVLADGLLGGAISSEPEGPLVASRMKGENLRHNLERVTVLKEMAAAKGSTAAQLATAWLLTRGGDILPLIGVSRRSRLEENLGCLDVTFTKDELQKLDATFANGAIRGDRYPEVAMKFQAR